MKKTIVIIGAGSGVGLAIAERFGKENYNVALLARNKNKLDKLVAELAAKGISAISFQADVMDRIGLANTLTTIKENFGTIDVIEFSPTPAIDSMRAPRDINVENAQYHLDFQVLSAITAVQSVLPEMLERKEGSILFTTAASAQKPLSITASFGVAAGALLNYARLLHKDLASDNIFAGIVSIAALVYNGDKPNEELLKHFPVGMPTISAEEVAETHWKMHLDQGENEIIVGDINAFDSILH